LIKLGYLACKDEGLTRTQYGCTAKICGLRQLKMIMFINCKQASHQQDMEFYLYTVKESNRQTLDIQTDEKEGFNRQKPLKITT
jgi:hypothetical protein